ncbi:YhjD/YihY/BrkB family envelope integrity protein [Streptacidiphilus sp. ASG 303]|uniref:YhjD/YihY/BrkB family envelope integrity protein n=1 Tax=Streptacidiphilus sp. ASG 303 TaxID=2896847 RepID=UPI00272A07FC|nr:YhjD/YihY/BrkB family envelope integrity protein [Streptacidiphilus sp. ASG 303]
MRAAARLDRFQRRHAWAAVPLAVVYKFADDQGTYLAALIAYYGLLSLFPLLLLLVSVLGFVLRDDPALQERVLHSALSQFPVIGDQLGSNIHSLHGSVPALVIGLAGSLYGSLGVAQAVQNALNRIWAVPRYARPNPLTSRLRSLLLLLILGAGLVLTTLLASFTTSAHAYGAAAGTGLRVLATACSVALNTLLVLLVLKSLTARYVPLRRLKREAVAAALAWQALQTVGTYYVGHVLQGTSATYGLFGIVLGLIAWLYLAALVFVLCAEAGVVRIRHLWPRNLLTPFTDRVHLTWGDRRAYASYAATETHKGFEDVEVDFRQRPPEGGPHDRPHPHDRSVPPDEPGGPGSPDAPDAPGSAGSSGRPGRRDPQDPPGSAA